MDSGICTKISKTICVLLMSTVFTGTLSAQGTVEVERDSVWIETGNGTIFGILFRPKGQVDKVLPAVYCLQGGGDVGLRNYFYEADYFARNGLVSLVCDKSGSGLSRTGKSWEQQSFEEKTTEYLEILTWLKSRSGVDGGKVGVHGMSEGGRLALNMAIRKPGEVAFVNSVSGPIDSFMENQLYAIDHHLKAQGTDESTIEQAIRAWRMYFEDIHGGLEISDKTLNFFDDIVSKSPTFRYRPANSKRLPLRPLKEDIKFTIEGKLQSIHCPVLYQYGERDTRVDPARSIKLIPTKSNFVIKNYRNTDHAMNQGNQIHPNYLSDKMTWLAPLIR